MVGGNRLGEEEVAEGEEDNVAVAVVELGHDESPEGCCEVDWVAGRQRPGDSFAAPPAADSGVRDDPCFEPEGSEIRAERFSDDYSRLPGKSPGRTNSPGSSERIQIGQTDPGAPVSYHRSDTGSIHCGTNLGERSGKPGSPARVH